MESMEYIGIESNVDLLWTSKMASQIFEIRQILWVDVSHSVCTVYCRFFLKKQNNVWLRRKAFTNFQHDFLRSEENLYMENFEVKAMSTAPHTPYLWKRYVDDTFTIIKSSHRRAFLDHINSIDQHIQFTSQDQREDGSMPFLDILVIPPLSTLGQSPYITIQL